MGLSITGYVLEPTRVGRSNSPFTFTPDIVITNQSVFDAAYPSSEANPRTEYHVFVLTDGDFPNPTFGWTKNEVISRFGHDGRNQRFKTLSGSTLEIPGTLATDSNTNRLAVSQPISTNLSNYPVRVSVGTGSGTTFLVTVVATDGAFGTPTVGSVELSQATGNLNWHATDLATYQGQEVRFQRQSFYSPEESTGFLGVIEDPLLLNPLPATGQYPIIRIGFGEYLTPVEVPSEAGFSPNPTAGTVEWSLSTGRLKFNSGDASANAGKAIYYDGSCFGFGLTVPTSSFGTVASPGSLGANPDETSGRFFRVPGVVQFAEVAYVDSLSTFGKRGRVEIRRSDGLAKFSFADQLLYGSQAVQLVIPDLSIERGMVLRWFRNPVDLSNTDPSLKDVSAFYTSLDSTLADPIIESPQVFLPAVPVETQPITVRIEQGTGSFTGVLPRLDVVSPPTGYGYVLDFETQQVRFARRRVNLVLTQSAQQPYGTVQLPDPLIQTSNLTLELETAPGAGTFNPVTLGTEATINYDAGLVTLVETDGALITSGSGGAFTSTTSFTDTTTNFVTAGVQSGDYLVTLSGSAPGLYSIDTVAATTLTVDGGATVEANLLYEIRRGAEILADRFFQEIPAVDPNTRVERLNSLGTATNAPRLAIDLTYINATRFRFGTTIFSTVSLVANDASFTTPGTLAAGTVEISQDTGNLNFSSADLGQDVFWARTLTYGTDYRLIPRLGFVQLTQRALENEEVFVTYATVDSQGNRTLVEERGTFLVRKELTSHPTPTDTIPFNPLGREVAPLPSPRVFRGGRPQDATKVAVSTAANTITFLSSDQVTDALPAGAPVDPTERVYIDYHIYTAIGGEDSLTVLQPPMAGATLTIEAESNSFSIAGNHVASFPVNYLLKVDNSEVYLLSGATFTPGADPTDPGSTLVSLASPQTFRSDLTNPTLAVSSGQTRVNSFFLFPSYFVTEAASWDTTPRGSNRLYLLDDLTRTYITGTVVLWTDGGSILDFNIVEGSVYDATLNRTVVTLASNGVRQYNSGGITLKRSVRPILASPTASVATSRSPDLSLPFQVFRRVEGSPGALLASPDDYRIDDSGRIQFTAPLQPNEELSIFYTGLLFIEDGRDFRASYTHIVAPSTTNGMKGQVLLMDYTTYAPDTVFWRVETMTNFRGELAQQFQDDATSDIPTGGPRLENAGGVQLYEEGSESLFFEEKHLQNEDLVARSTLKFYNDGVNLLEDALQSIDGRVVGDHDGRFLFDGNVTNPIRTSMATVTNQIDDILKVANGPPIITFPPFAVSFAGTYQEVYKPSRFSRFYPTRRNLYGVTADPTGLETGDTILVTDFGNWSKANQISRRLPWAVTTEPAAIGSILLTVDDADGAEDLLRPAFKAATYTHRVAILAQDGTVLVSPATPLDVSAATATTITLSAPLSVVVPVGSTVYQVPYENPLSPSATPFPKFYRQNYDVGINLRDGELTHIQAFPPFDGSIGGFPAELEIQNPPAGEVLDAFVWITNNLTEPDRIPVLDGGTQDDDRNRQFPILSPSATSEIGSGVGYLAQEKNIVETGGTLRLATTAPFIGTGSLSLANTRITLDAGTFPAPVPKVGDLVRILSGANTGLDFRKVTATNGSTYVDVAGGDAWPTADTAFSFTVTVATSLESGTAALTVLTIITDLLATFQTNGVKVGHTVVALSGVNTGLRRQVVSVLSETVLVTTAWPANDGAMSYAVDNPLSTYGGTGSLLPTLNTILNGEIDVLSTNTPPTEVYNELDAIEMFLDHFFTDIVTSATGTTVATSPTLTDTSVNFVTAGVDSTHFVFVRSGANAGVYRVDSVTGPTTLDVDAANPFPNTSGGFSYRIVDSGGLIEQTLSDLQSILEEIDQAIVNAQAFLTLISTTVSVFGDAGAFATGLLTSSLNTRESQITARETQLDPNTGAPATLSSVLSSGDRLYDRRYVWIDARINLETGTLPKKERAGSNRLKAEANILKQLTKILSTRP